MATLEAALVFGARLVVGGGCGGDWVCGHGYRFLCCRVESFILGFFGGSDRSIASLQPHMPAATAEPAKQSSQWLSGAEGLSFHS